MNCVITYKRKNNVNHIEELIINSSFISFRILENEEVKYDKKIEQEISDSVFNKIHDYVVKYSDKNDCLINGSDVLIKFENEFYYFELGKNEELFYVIKNLVKNRFMNGFELYPDFFDISNNENAVVENKYNSMCFIKRVEVKGLFGLYSYSIDLNEGISILYAPNAFGKTTLFNLLYCLLAKPIDDKSVIKQLQKIRNISFEFLKIDFTNNKSICVERTGRANRNDYVHGRTDLYDLIYISYFSDEKEEKTIKARISLRMDEYAYDFIKEHFNYLYGHFFDNEENKLIFSVVDRKNNPDVYAEKEKVAYDRFFKSLIENIRSKTDKQNKVNVDEAIEAINNNLDELHGLTASRKFPDFLLELNKGLRDIQKRINERLSVKCQNNLDNKHNFCTARALYGIWEDQKNGISERTFPLYARSEYSYEDLKAEIMNDEKAIDFFERFERMKNQFSSLYFSENPAKKTLRIINDSIRAIPTHSRERKELPISRLSSGEINILSLLYDLNFNMENGTIMLMDEPEISLHIAWQKKITDIIDETVRFYKNQGKSIQIFISSHSPYLIENHTDFFIDPTIIQ